MFVRFSASMALLQRRDAFYQQLEKELLVRARMLTAGARRRDGMMLADDLVQETLAKLIESYGLSGLKERTVANVFSLAYRTMKNLMIDESRRKRAYLASGSTDDEDEPMDLRATDAGPLQDARLETERRTLLVTKGLDTLTPEERRFLTEVIERDSVPAAQAACGWPPASPYYVLKRLLKQVKDAIGPEVARELLDT